MTKLTTHIKLEDVKKSKKLQGIGYEKNYYLDYKGEEHCLRPIEMLKQEELLGNDFIYCSPAPTIADCIDNAEELFWDNSCIESTNKKATQYIQNEIFKKYQQNKSIEEIGEYILENIK